MRSQGMLGKNIPPLRDQQSAKLTPPATNSLRALEGQKGGVTELLRGAEVSQLVHRPPCTMHARPQGARTGEGPWA